MHGLKPVPFKLSDYPAFGASVMKPAAGVSMRQRAMPRLFRALPPSGEPAGEVVSSQ
jgi:hypothetical protein